MLHCLMFLDILLFLRYKIHHCLYNIVFYLYLTLRFDLLSKFRQMELIRKEDFGHLSPSKVSRRWLTQRSVIFESLVL